MTIFFMVAKIVDKYLPNLSFSQSDGDIKAYVMRL